MVEVASGEVTLPNSPMSWKMKDNRDATYTLTLSSSKITLDLRPINELVRLSQQYFYIITPHHLRYAQFLIHSGLNIYDDYREWKLEKDYQNTISS